MPASRRRGGCLVLARLFHVANVRHRTDGPVHFAQSVLSEVIVEYNWSIKMNRFGKYLSPLFVAVALVSVVGCTSTPKQEGTGEYMDDTVITGKVKTAILNEPTLKVAEINVETFKGVVQLSGFVSSQAAATKAVEVTREVGGVKSVKNDMRIK
jgi:BON domain